MQACGVHWARVGHTLGTHWVCIGRIGHALGTHCVRIGHIGHTLGTHCVCIAHMWWALRGHGMHGSCMLTHCQPVVVFFFSPGTCEHKNNPIPHFSFFLFSLSWSFFFLSFFTKLIIFLSFFSLSWSFFIFYFCSFHILHFFYLVLFYVLFSSSFLPTTSRRTLLPALAKEAIPGNQLEGRW